MLEIRPGQRYLSSPHNQVATVNRNEGAISNGQGKQRELIKFRKRDNNHQTFTERWFEDEMEAARLSIETAILTGRYSPGDASEKTNISNKLQEPINETLDPSSTEKAKNNSVSQLTREEHELFFQRVDNMREDLIRYLGTRFGIRSQNGEDLVQDAILKIVIFSYTGGFGRQYLDPKRLKPLMLRAVRFARVDWLRKIGGQGLTPRPYQISIDEIRVGSKDYNRLGYEDDDLEGIVNQKKEYLQRVKFALPDLSEYQRRVLILRVFFGLNPVQVGKILGKEERDIRAVFSQTKKKLRKMLIAT